MPCWSCWKASMRKASITPWYPQVDRYPQWTWHSWHLRAIYILYIYHMFSSINPIIFHRIKPQCTVPLYHPFENILEALECFHLPTSEDVDCIPAMSQYHSISIESHYLVGGWATPLKNMKVSWDYYSQYMEKIKHVPNHQPVMLYRVSPGLSRLSGSAAGSHGFNTSWPCGVTGSASSLLGYGRMM